MPRPDSRLALALLAAGAVSFLIGLGFTKLTAVIPCQGESLACDIDQAIGTYGVVIFAMLGPFIFGLTLLIARNRAALVGAMGVLLLPPIAFFLIDQIEYTLYLGLEPTRQLRTFVVLFLPPALTVLVQYLVLRLAVPAAPPPNGSDGT